MVDFLLAKKVQSSDIAKMIVSLCSPETMHSLKERGFPLRAPGTLRGRAAFRRFVQWTLAKGLRKAAYTGSFELLEPVGDLCDSDLAKSVDPPDAPGSLLGAAQMDAMSAEANTHLFIKKGDLEHRLHGVANTFGGQYPPEGALSALELFDSREAWNIMEPAWAIGVEREFAERAAAREQIPEMVKDVTWGGSEHASMSARFLAVAGNGKPIISYTIRATDCDTGCLYFRSMRAGANQEHQSFEEGTHYFASVDGLPAEHSFAVTVYAWNGQQGPASKPFFASTAEKSSLSKRPLAPGKQQAIKYVR